MPVTTAGCLLCGSRTPTEIRGNELVIQAFCDELCAAAYEWVAETTVGMAHLARLTYEETRLLVHRLSGAS